MKKALLVLLFLAACSPVAQDVDDSEPNDDVDEQDLQNIVDVAQGFSCTEDAECVLKTNGVNCVRAFHEKDTSEYEVQIPPSKTICPDSEDVVAYCDAGLCAVKYDCSKCGVLKEKLDEFCMTHMEGTSSGICRMYVACGC